MDKKSVDELLTTTRTVRMRLDFTRPIDPKLVQECIDIAIQAPTASNGQSWAFFVITDARKRELIAHYYRLSWDEYIKDQSFEETAVATAEQMQRVGNSATYLAENIQNAPMMIIPCYEWRVEKSQMVMAQASMYGSILPATWSLMLALRSRAIGCAWTTLHLRYEREIAEILGIPEHFTQVALLPIAYYLGKRFKPAARRPAKDITFWDTWGQTRKD